MKIIKTKNGTIGHFDKSGRLDDKKTVKELEKELSDLEDSTEKTFKRKKYNKEQSE